MEEKTIGTKVRLVLDEKAMTDKDYTIVRILP